MDDTVIANIRSRIDRCRGLAAHMTDERTRSILEQMADEGEADIARLQAQQDDDTAAG